MLCGYVYETEKEELPEDFTCPLCGAPRDMFEKID
ncbi:MAG: rubredoxin [Bacilli bacterium]|nr:rubredoxin [Bacilli bacterium]